MIEQWNFQHDRGVPFPEIPLPITIKRSGDAKHYWQSLQVHNAIISKATKTIDSYLPHHVMAMRQRKTRNRNIILKNHQRGLKLERQKKRMRHRRSTSAIGGSKTATSNKAATAIAFVKKHQLKESSAQQLRDWSFREKVVETTLEMYAPKQYLPHRRSSSRISLDRAPVEEPFLKQQGPAGLSINYLRASLTPSPGISTRQRPKSATQSQTQRLSAASATAQKIRRKSNTKTKRTPKRRPQSARRGSSSTGRSVGSSGRGSGRGQQRPQSAQRAQACRKAPRSKHSERSERSVDYLRDENTGEWIGMKRSASAASAAAMRSGVESNQKRVTLQHHLMETAGGNLLGGKEKRPPATTFKALGKSGDTLVGERLQVLWKDSENGAIGANGTTGENVDGWYNGTIEKFRNEDGCHFVLFEDGDSDWYDLDTIQYRVGLSLLIENKL